MADLQEKGLIPIVARADNLQFTQVFFTIELRYFCVNICCMEAKGIEQEMNTYFMQMNLAEKKIGSRND